MDVKSGFTRHNYNAVPTGPTTATIKLRAATTCWAKVSFLDSTAAHRVARRRRVKILIERCLYHGRDLPRGTRELLEYHSDLRWRRKEEGGVRVDVGHRV